MIEIIKFKFVSNLEYVHTILDEQNIPHSIDIENIVLYSDNVYKSRIIEIIDQLNLDENEVEVDENFQKDFDDWHKNSLNPGHFTGGRVPFFYWNVKNFPFLAFTIFFSPIISIIILFGFGSGEFNMNFDFYSILIFLIYLFIAISMLVQWINYRKNKKK